MIILKHYIFMDSLLHPNIYSEKHVGPCSSDLLNLGNVHWRQSPREFHAVGGLSIVASMCIPIPPPSPTAIEYNSWGDHCLRKFKLCLKCSPLTWKFMMALQHMIHTWTSSLVMARCDCKGNFLLPWREPLTLSELLCFGGNVSRCSSCLQGGIKGKGI